MGKVYLQPAGVDRPIAGLGGDEQGPDADDPALTIEVWRERIRRHPGELKNLLRNQAFVAGIGNAYSDEILHAARLLPFRKRASLAAEEVDALYEATGSTLTGAIDDPSRAGPTDVRDPGPRLPRGPRQGWPAVSALRDQDHRGQGRRLHHVVLPGLPALRRDQAQLDDLADMQLRRVLDVVERGEDLDGRPELRGDARQRVARLTLYEVGCAAVAVGAAVGPVGTRVGLATAVGVAAGVGVGAAVGFAVAGRGVMSAAATVVGLGESEPIGMTTPASEPPPDARRAISTAAKAMPSTPIRTPCPAIGRDAIDGSGIASRL